MEIIIAVVTACAIGVVTFFGKKAYDMICQHRKDHQLLRQFPDYFSKHTNEHETIKDMIRTTQDILEDNRKDNMELQKRQLLDSYEMAKKRGYWTLYEKEAWLSMYDRYRANDGNSFVEDIRHNHIDDIPVR